MTPHSATTDSASKRQKLHPLRQTSFPVDGAASIFYPQSAVSETASVATSHVSGYSSKTGKKLGRPRKSDRQSVQLNDDDLAASQVDGASVERGSQRGTGRGGTRSVISARSGEDVEEDDEGDLDGMLGSAQDQARREEEEKREAQRVDRLVSTFTPDQEQRYNLWRATKLNRSQLRRIVNQTVSQSVASNPLLAISIYAKFFVGEIIERAREVQIQWAQAYEQTRQMNEKAMREELDKLEADARRSLGRPDEIRARQRKMDNLKKELEAYMPNPHKGGLMPDHLREAVRRYKGDGEGGGVGFGSQSHGLVGVKGSGAWRVGQGNGGKRLFR